MRRCVYCHHAVTNPVAPDGARRALAGIIELHHQVAHGDPQCAFDLGLRH